ncbi:MAG: DEAD/DEAH box helicase family protein [Candidatus Omnitrophica bacterium]|nr:DEAD/DEAH box helicase family protein [Candidatus Omnitrophota bacterium]
MNIEKYLILNKYILSLFGVYESKELFSKFKDVKEGFDSDGRSYFVNALIGLENLKISEDDLLRYDENIQSYVRKINYKRQFISLKYFQYLAVLFSEIVLDNLKNRKIEFLYELNKFLEKYKQEQDIAIIDSFTENDLKKLAFWMATGSGKTLIMHINYYQFFNYKLFSPDNIILLTPNGGLSKQHFEELQKSNIPSRLYSGCLNGGFKIEDEVLVIEITKFVEEKKGGGLSLPIDIFEGKNLIFVDEGHKGKRSEEQKWAKLRDILSENGFVFEYSATFGQILSEKQSEILKEYGKSIVFDYSYKYFYLDGYGKDFSILNITRTRTSDEEFQEAMFIGNLLSFYEQLLAYEENKGLMKEYNIEKPLWIFVGTTVTGNRNEPDAIKTDVIQILEFIIRAIQDEKWVKNWIEKIINGRTNLINEKGEDIFQKKFKYLRIKAINLEDLYKKVFGGKGKFSLYEIKNAEGEIGLKVGENEYFGVVNIGDISGFKKQLEKKGIIVDQDVMSGSLFDSIKKEDSNINILIGSKKFIEGWDTWRVSSMGLLNIGRGEGPQIIQLFGRGVRLKGKGMSLKRSGDNLPIQVLETLNIYGIKADYLSKFLEVIRTEEIDFETIEIPIELQHKDKWDDLKIFSKSDKKFEENVVLSLEVDDKISFVINLIPKVLVYQTEERREKGIKIEEVKLGIEEKRFSEDIINLLNWQKILNEIFEFKMIRNYWNLVFDSDALKNVLLYAKYFIIAPPKVFEVKNKEDIEKLENIAILVIKKYLDLFYTRKLKQFETINLQYDKVKQIPLPFLSDKKYGYIIKIDREKREIIREIKNLINNFENLKKEDERILPRIYFENSLYVPILLQTKEIDKISPEGLVESEKKFILDLRKYLRNNKHKFSSTEIYILRNFPKSGIGFQLEWAGFYPDFIMWVRNEDKEIIVFIDPHGLGYNKSLNNEKIVFAGFKPEDSDIITIKDIEKKLGSNTFLESFILSPTKYEELKRGEINFPLKEKFEECHVLFLDDSNWPEKLFSFILKK